MFIVNLLIVVLKQQNTYSLLQIINTLNQQFDLQSDLHKNIEHLVNYEDFDEIVYSDIKDETYESIFFNIN